ncbi:hypothetical protein MPTK1_6g15280 [Marchantia polymorpha subsp. ruderalis]|uniref:Uncharacterized protein n=2 Tax=Marchantia polymorpha TaxID=3197 RepID=A0AAF6BS97_MARPO|nr:hypothetical protein MARPO_0056s0038 [Marchantia polymorpha]BBN14881.1 hypothetical protein Mp_6g15280 [Marchantia polymorpha subsp. ruderalis]|eukprot:PTQ37563.1 hypothetical protein MARPO_0056s0038 [Marchantia polymorpha]
MGAGGKGSKGREAERRAGGKGSKDGKGRNRGWGWGRGRDKDRRRADRGWASEPLRPWEEQVAAGAHNAPHAWKEQPRPHRRKAPANFEEFRPEERNVVSGAGAGAHLQRCAVDGDDDEGGGGGGGAAAGAAAGAGAGAEGGEGGAEGGYGYGEDAVCGDAQNVRTGTATGLDLSFLRFLFRLVASRLVGGVGCVSHYVVRQNLQKLLLRGEMALSLDARRKWSFCASVVMIDLFCRGSFVLLFVPGLDSRSAPLTRFFKPREPPSRALMIVVDPPSCPRRSRTCRPLCPLGADFRPLTRSSRCLVDRAFLELQLNVVEDFELVRV